MNGRQGRFASGADPWVDVAGSYQLMVKSAADIIERCGDEVRAGVTPDRQSELTRTMRQVRRRRDAVDQGDNLSAATVHRQLLHLPAGAPTPE